MTDLRPTVNDLAPVLRRPGPLERPGGAGAPTPPLRDIAVGPVRRNGEEREGALPAAAEALAGATPRIAFARPYSVDFTGWLDDFSHCGQLRRDGRLRPDRDARERVLAQERRALAARARAARRGRSRSLRRPARTTAARARSSATAATAPCPGSPPPDFNCDPTQVPVGRMRRLVLSPRRGRRGRRGASPLRAGCRRRRRRRAPLHRRARQRVRHGARAATCAWPG